MSLMTLYIIYRAFQQLNTTKDMLIDFIHKPSVPLSTIIKGQVDKVVEFFKYFDLIDNKLKFTSNTDDL